MSEHHLKDDLKGALEQWDRTFYEAESVVERMKQARIAVLRTDRNGLSTIRTDGRVLVTGQELRTREDRNQ